MKISKSLSFILIISVILGSILACSIFKPDAIPNNNSRSHSSSTSKSDFVEKTEVRIDELEIKPGMWTNVLKINALKLTAGELTFRLIDPDGQVHWEETFTAPAKFNEKFDLEVIPGVWQLEIDFVNASGKYNLKWEAKN